MTEDHVARKRIAELEIELRNARKDNERLRDVKFGNGGSDLTLAAKVAALDKEVAIMAALAIDVRKDIGEGIKGVHARLDTMNGNVATHEKRIDGHDIRLAFASGGVAVLTILIMVFGGIILVKAWP